MECGTDYTTVAGYNTAVAGAIQLHTVNNASNSTEARTALQPIAVVTASTGLSKSATSKLEVAELFLDDDAFVALVPAGRTSVDADGDYTAAFLEVKDDLEALTDAYDDSIQCSYSRN